MLRKCYITFCVTYLILYLMFGFFLPNKEITIPALIIAIAIMIGDEKKDE